MMQRAEIRTPAPPAICLSPLMLFSSLFPSRPLLFHLPELPGQPYQPEAEPLLPCLVHRPSWVGDAGDRVEVRNLITRSTSANIGEEWAQKECHLL